MLVVPQLIMGGGEERFITDIDERSHGQYSEDTVGASGQGRTSEYVRKE